LFSLTLALRSTLPFHADRIIGLNVELDRLASGETSCLSSAYISAS
jgi:hypothetical protein